LIYAVAVAAAAAFTVFGCAQADFVLVSGGEPRAEIVRGENQSSSTVAFAVDELQRYVKEMSGFPYRLFPHRPGSLLFSSP